MKITLAVEMDDGTEHEVTTNLGDVIRFERKFGVSAADLGGDGLRVEWFAFLAWSACRHRKIIPTSVDFEQWVDDLASVTPVDVDQEISPPGGEEAAAG